MDISSLTFDEKNLIPVIVQNAKTKKILMFAFANREAVSFTQKTGFAHFWSRSRKKLWKKGEESGNILKVKEIKTDCDSDALLYLVTPVGNTCHTGAESCFFRSLTPHNGDEKNISHIAYDTTFLFDLENIISDRRKNPVEKSYVHSLFDNGLDRIAQKVGEEAVETVIAAKNDNDDDFLNEASDLFFHYLVLLQAKEKTFQDILETLHKRHSS